MNVNEIIQKVKESSLKGPGCMELNGANKQKLIVPLQKKDSVCMELIPIIAHRIKNNTGKDPTIADCLNVLTDTYWWLQTFTLLYSKTGNIEERIRPEK